MASHDVIRATKVKNCAQRVRMRYELGRPVDESFLELFGEGTGWKVAINRFSKLVAGAKDHYVLAQPWTVHVSGVLGDDELVATYWLPDPIEGDLSSSVFEEAPIAPFERMLVDYCGSTIVRC